MTIEQELRLSYYQKVADINADHCIYLVQDVRTKKFYVKKLLTVYNADIYHYLQEHPIPNTPQIILAEEADSVLTVIEEYVPGDTLEELLEKQGAFPEDQVINITCQLCTILEAFHGCYPPIVNRDIKPSNIKLTPEGVVKLLDLNAAKWSNGQAEKDTVLLGTQGYAAPEQYGFGPSSVLTDIYSVGVLMNVMLTGDLPGRRMASGRLAGIIRKCVELSPASRYQSIRELHAVLNALSGKAAPEDLSKANWKRFLPPGFRKKNIIRWLFSALGYAFLFYIGFTLEVENATSTAEIVLNRIFFTLACLLIILFNGNYLGVHQKFVMTRSKRRWVRWLGMALVDFAILALWILVLDLLVTSFLR